MFMIDKKYEDNFVHLSQPQKDNLGKINSEALELRDKIIAAANDGSNDDRIRQLLKEYSGLRDKRSNIIADPDGNKILDQNHATSIANGIFDLKPVPIFDLLSAVLTENSEKVLFDGVIKSFTDTFRPSTGVTIPEKSKEIMWDQWSKKIEGIISKHNNNFFPQSALILFYIGLNPHRRNRFPRKQF